MTTSKAEYKRFNCIGPGGRKCACCYPAPGKSRRKWEKIFKKQERTEAKRAIFFELLEG